MRRTAAALAVAVAVGALAGCGGDGDDGQALALANDAPDATALALFALARAPRESGADLAATIVDPARAAADPGALHDALDALRDARRARVLAVEPLDDGGSFAIDLEAELPGPAVASYSAQVESAADGTWRVAWFAGPGVEWPPRSAPRGDGLAVSPPGGGP